MEPRWLVTVDENFKVKVEKLANISQSTDINKLINILKSKGFTF